MGRIVGLIASLALVCGCALGEVLADYGDPVDMRPSDLVGTWQSGPSRRFVFEQDGTFDATDLPYDVVDFILRADFDPARHRLDGSGTWELTAPHENPDGPASSVELSFRRLAGADMRPGAIPLSALRQDGQVFLVFHYVGDGGNSWTAYQKCIPDCG